MGAGCLVGAGALLLLMLFGMAMCAGHFEEQMHEHLQEQFEELPPRERPDTDAVRYLEFPHVRQAESQWASRGGICAKEEYYVSGTSIRTNHKKVLSRL